MLSDTVRRDEFTIISSGLGSVVFLFLAIAAFYLLGVEPLWLPMKGGGQNFNPIYLLWLAALIPTGSFLGCMLSLKNDLGRVSWLTRFCGWFVGCIAGYIVSWQMVALLGVLHPLFVSGVGLALTLLMFWLAFKKAQTKPSRIQVPL